MSRKKRRKSSKINFRPSLRPQYVTFRDPFTKIPYEELIKAFADTGKSHEEQFDKLLIKTKNLIASFNPLHLLSVLSVYGLSTGVTKSGKIQSKKAHSLGQPHVELAQALALSIPAESVISENIATPDRIQEIWDSLIALADSFHLRRLSYVSSLRSREERSLLYLQEHIRLNTQMVRNWGYFKTAKQILSNLYGAIDPLYEKEVGISPNNLIRIFEYLMKCGDSVINDHWEHLRPLRKCKSPDDAVATYFEVYPDLQGTANELQILLKKHKNSLQSTISFLMSHSDLRLPEMFSFSIQDLADSLGLDQGSLSKSLPKLSLRSSALSNTDPEHFFLSNPVWTKPLIRLSENTYFCPMPQIFFAFAFDILDHLPHSPKARELCARRRSEFLEDEIESLLNSSFPNGKLFRNFRWTADGNQYETDFILKADSVLLIVEAKSGSISSPALRGAPYRLKRHVKELIIEPAIQSLRLENKILSLMSDLSTNNNTPKQYPIDLNKIHKIIRLSVTLEDFATLQSNLSILRDTGLFTEHFHPVPTITLADLHIVLDILESIPVKIHYFLRRRTLETKQLKLLGDEIDILGFYLENGLNISSVEDQDMGLQLVEMSRSVDHYYQAKDHGISRKKPSLKSTKWWMDIRQKIEQRSHNRWIEATLMLLDFPVDEQVKAEKAFKKVKKNVKKNWMRPGHINTVVMAPPKQKSHAVVLLAFRERQKNKRRFFMEDIVRQVFSETHAEGCLVIGINIDRPTYPYNILGVFDAMSNDLKQTKTNNTSKT